MKISAPTLGQDRHGSWVFTYRVEGIERQRSLARWNGGGPVKDRALAEKLFKRVEKEFERLALEQAAASTTPSPTLSEFIPSLSSTPRRSCRRARQRTGAWC